jgi:hypothetical protein
MDPSQDRQSRSNHRTTQQRPQNADWGAVLDPNLVPSFGVRWYWWIGWITWRDLPRLEGYFKHPRPIQRLYSLFNCELPGWESIRSVWRSIRSQTPLRNAQWYASLTCSSSNPDGCIHLSGEFVTEVVVWSTTTQEAISGIQFVTNMGRVSPHYGGYGGKPTVFNNDGGALVAFSGRLTMHTQQKEYMVSQLQASRSLQMLR